MIGYIQRAKTALFIAIILNCGTAWSGTQDEVPPLDYLSFAQGAIPVAVGGEPLARSNFEHAVSAIDGNEGGFVYTTAIDPGSVVEFVYELPALTTFSRLAVPGVYETPSPSQTFARDVEVQGSSTSATEGFVVLGKTSLSTHAGKGEVTDLVIESRVPVRWLKLVLSNGIDVQREKMFLGDRGRGAVDVVEQLRMGVQLLSQGSHLRQNILNELLDGFAHAKPDLTPCLSTRLL